MGGIAGGAIGGIIGSLIAPGIGTAIGGAIGGAVGSYGGEFVGQNFTAWTESANKSLSAFKAEFDTTIRGAGDSFRQLFVDFGYGVDNNMRYIGDGISNNFEYAVNGVSNNFDYLKGKAGDFADGVIKFIGNAETDVSAKFQTMADNATNNWETIKQGASDLATSLETAFDSAIATIKGKFSELAARASEKLTSIASSISGAVSAVGKRAYNWAVGEPQAFATGTSHFEADGVPSFATGINSFRASALAQINEHGGELVQLPDGSKVFPTAETRQIINHEVKYGDLLKGRGFPANINISGGNNNSSPSAPAITITGNNFTVREDADIDKIAHALVEKFLLVQGNYAGC